MAGQHDVDAGAPAVLIGLLGDIGGDGEASIVDENFQPAEMLCRFIDDTLDRLAIADIHGPAFDVLQAGIPDLLHDGVDGLLFEVGNGNIRAFMGKEVGGRAAHAGGGAGDERGLAFDRAGKRLIGLHGGLLLTCFSGVRVRGEGASRTGVTEGEGRGVGMLQFAVIPDFASANIRDPWRLRLCSP